MTATTDDHAPRGPRRPPAPPRQWGTVTHLGGRRPGDEPAGAAPASPLPVDGSLALAGRAPGTPPGTPMPDLRVVGAARERRRPEEVQAWAARFAQAVVEVLGGDRPLSQLVRWTSQRVHAELERRLSLLAHTATASRRMRAVRPQVRSVHVCRPTAEAAEVSVHVRHGPRSRAIAARLELVDGRWQCTALQLG